MEAAKTTKDALNAHYLRWLRENMRLGVDLVDLLRQLREAGYTDKAIADGLDAVRPQNDSLANGAPPPPPLIQRNPPNLKRFDSDEVELYTLENFLSVKECEKLLALIAHHLQPSTVSHFNGDHYFRTSQTSHLSHLKSPVSVATDDKICRTLGIRPDYAEGIQAQRYDVGQQFKPHWDYFEPGTREYMRFAGTRGNRTWTFMVYLNEGMEGGGTRFTSLDHTFQPKIGRAVLWNNLKPDGSGNKATMHSGEPVTQGHKVIITKWFRAIGDGPLYF